MYMSSSVFETLWGMRSPAVAEVLPLKYTPACWLIPPYAQAEENLKFYLKSVDGLWRQVQLADSVVVQRCWDLYKSQGVRESHTGCQLLQRKTFRDMILGIL